jgi:hypothetical protein
MFRLEGLKELRLKLMLELKNRWVSKDVRLEVILKKRLLKFKKRLRLDRNQMRFKIINLRKQLRLSLR